MKIFVRDCGANCDLHKLLMCNKTDDFIRGSHHSQVLEDSCELERQLLEDTMLLEKTDYISMATEANSI